jgi:hypothetical protein
MFSSAYMEDMEINPQWKVSECSGKDFAEKYLSMTESRGPLSKCNDYTVYMIDKSTA